MPAVTEAPARSDEYLYYQTLIGVLPFGAEYASFEDLRERQRRLGQFFHGKYR